MSLRPLVNSNDNVPLWDEGWQFWVDLCEGNQIPDKAKVNVVFNCTEVHSLTTETHTLLVVVMTLFCHLTERSASKSTRYIQSDIATLEF
jgi:hypothetical protein